MKLEIFPRDRGENNKYLKPPPSFGMAYFQGQTVSFRLAILLASKGSEEDANLYKHSEFSEKSLVQRETLKMFLFFWKSGRNAIEAQGIHELWVACGGVKV